MTERCKECGQIMPPKQLPVGVEFSPTKKRLFEAITRWPGMTTRDLMAWCYADSEDGGPDDHKNIHVNICQMNKKLREHGLELSAYGRDGYSLKYLAPATPRAF